MSLIEINKVSKVYGAGSTEFYALKEVSFTAEEGEFAAILGPSGSGKSTLLNIIGGLDKPTSGSVKINGMELSNSNDKKMADYRRKEIGFVFQSYNLIPTLNVKENILLPMLLDHRKPDEAYMEELLSLLGILEKKNDYVHQLSGGQQQRVAIARALANKPHIILADEPTGNLDSDTSRDVMNLLIASAKKYHQTILMITHNADLATLANRIIRIESGRIIEK